MSQQFTDALQWLQILSGVGHGLISTSDVNNIAKRLGIPDDSIPKLKEYLNTKGMDIIPYDQKADPLASLSAASVPAPQYHRFDTVLDKLLDSSPQTEFMGYWLEQLYQGRTNRSFSRVVFLKLAGIPTETIAVTLQLPIERIFSWNTALWNTTVLRYTPSPASAHATRTGNRCRTLIFSPVPPGTTMSLQGGG